MISIVICSRKETISDLLLNNIHLTILTEYELIIIDNSKNNYSIYEAYNLGIEKSKGDLICFLHDDILLHTKGWGNIIKNIFSSNEDVGLLGIAGSKIKTKTPSAWSDCPEDKMCIYILQHFPGKENRMIDVGFNFGFTEEVVGIDGVFMILRKDKRICFKKNIKGFHNYDFNISCEYKRFGYKILVSNQILIEHFSLGILNGDWVESTYKMHKIYRYLLPMSLEKSRLRSLEIKNAKYFIFVSLKFKKINIAFISLFKLLCLDPFSLFDFKFMVKGFYLLFK